MDCHDLPGEHTAALCSPRLLSNKVQQTRIDRVEDVNTEQSLRERPEPARPSLPRGDGEACRDEERAPGEHERAPRGEVDQQRLVLRPSDEEAVEQGK